jgi:hypothetical protein
LGRRRIRRELNEEGNDEFVLEPFCRLLCPFIFLVVVL